MRAASAQVVSQGFRTAALCLALLVGCGAKSELKPCLRGTCLQSSTPPAAGAPEPCRGVVCADPPPPECVGERIAREYASVGSCEAGRCQYRFVDGECTLGCSTGVCVEDLCSGVACMTPPPPECIADGPQLRVYDQVGECRAGECVYGWSNTACRSGCEGQQCIDPEEIVELTAGFDHTCARRRSGVVLCWGSNDTGELGDGTEKNRSVPAPVLDLRDAVEISAAGSHACARRESGFVSCWGWNRSGQLGNGTTTQSELPVAVAGIADAVAIATAVHHTCAVRASGEVACWGSNGHGGLGDGTTMDRTTPAVVVGLADAVEVAVGATQVRGGHSCARTLSGRVMCWGYNYHGELGDGTKVDRLLPVQVLDLQDSAELGAGHFHTCARTSAGTVLQWGVDWATGLDWQDRPQPATDLGDVVEIAAGGTHTCARHTLGKVSCWGSNDHGQLGDGTSVDHKAPGVVVELAAAIGLGAGENHTCARLAAGGVACWGSNGGGQLGDGTTIDRGSPVMVTGL